jgi:hypothetical protein
MTRGNARTSWHDKRTPGRRDERRHNLVVFRVQTESTGKVAAMVMLVLSINQKDWALEMNCKYLVYRSFESWILYHFLKASLN